MVIRIAVNLIEVISFDKIDDKNTAGRSDDFMLVDYRLRSLTRYNGLGEQHAER